LGEITIPRYRSGQADRLIKESQEIGRAIVLPRQGDTKQKGKKGAIGKNLSNVKNIVNLNKFDK